MLALIGVIPREQWPAGATPGDYRHLPLGDATHRPDDLLVDPVTRAAAAAFLANGGREGHVVAVCLDRARSLYKPDVAVNGVLAPALSHIAGLDTVGLLAMPGLAYLPAAHSIGPWAALLDHCRQFGARFLMVDPPRHLDGTDLQAWCRQLADQAGPAASHGAVYHPWLQHGEHAVPPSGAVAGQYALIERTHSPFGFRWPPANHPLRAVDHPALELGAAELDAMVEAHVNPIVTAPGRGVVVRGARTLARTGPCRFVNTRRIASAVAEQLRRDSEWALFEDHGPSLWPILTRTLGARLDQLTSSGVLAGASDRAAYRVQCDAELNPPAAQAAGRVHVRVELQPISTTERIVIDLQLGA